MGRRPKAPGLENFKKLTQNQFDLLAWVYVSGYQTAADIHIIWSPKAFLRQSPTKTEAAVLSRRVKGLVDRELLSRHGRELSITDWGKTELAIYASERAGDPIYDGLLARVELDNALFGLGLSRQLVSTFIAIYRDEFGLEPSDAESEARKFSKAFSKHSVNQAIQALERFKEARDRRRKGVKNKSVTW